MENIFIQRNGFKDFVNKVYAYMGIGLIITAALALFISLNFETIILSIGFNAFSTISIICALAELVVAIYLSVRIEKISLSTAKVLFFLYSVLTGLSFGTIFLTYSLGSIASAFLITAVVFICMSIIGKTTNIDLTKIGNILLIGLGVCIVLSIIELFFLHSTMLDLIITYIEVVIFLGLTAYDTQKLQAYYNYGENFAVFGALQLYLDFVNLFLKVLRIFGKRKD